MWVVHVVYVSSAADVLGLGVVRGMRGVDGGGDVYVFGPVRRGRRWG